MPGHPRRQPRGHRLREAGIYRAGKPALCADPKPPARLIEHARAIGADLKLYGPDFGFQRMDNQWFFPHGRRPSPRLPIPALRGGYQMVNASAALAVLECLKERLPVSMGAVKRGLLEVEWPGRFQVLPGRPAVVLDVGHNPHAVKAMVASLKQLPFARNRLAVFSMLEDRVWPRWRNWRARSSTPGSSAGWTCRAVRAASASPPSWRKSA